MINITIGELFVCAGWKSVESVPMLVERYMKKEMMVDEFVSHNMPLPDINTAFDLMHQGKRYAKHALHTV